jgi:carbon storage regulator
MLVLTRRNGESFFIGEGIEVRVLGVVCNQERLGIEAPKDMRGFREELRERFGAAADVASAATTAAGDLAASDVLSEPAAAAA